VKNVTHKDSDGMSGINDSKKNPLFLARNSGKYRRLSRKRNAVNFVTKGRPGYEKLYFYSDQYEGDFGRSGEVEIKYKISLDNNICLSDHIVYGQFIFPTDAYLEMLVVACRAYFGIHALRFENIAIANPLVGNGASVSEVTIVFQKYRNGLRFVVRSINKGQSNRGVDVIHMRGFLYPLDERGEYAAKPKPPLDKGVIDTQPFPVERFYSNDSGIVLGPFYRSLKELTFGAQSAVGKIKVRSRDDRFIINPSVVSAALANAMSYGPHRLQSTYKTDEDLFLPHKIEKLVVFGSLTGDSYTSVAEVKNVSENSIELYLEIIDENNNAILVFETLRLQRVKPDRYEKPIAQYSLKSTPSADLPAKTMKQPDNYFDIAVIGMSCCFPKSKNVEEFWAVLKSGEDCITEVPDDRWVEFDDWYDPDPLNQHTSYSKWGGFIDDVDKFDPLFFNISPSEAEVMDPQQRKFLEQAWKAIESAGYAPSTLSTKQCGVFVGCTTGDYDRLLAIKGEDTNGQSFMGTSSAILAARISYFLNLKGPSLTIDTACSSSLAAVHLACMSIRNGESDLSIVGGVSIFATPMAHILTSRVGMQSAAGRCFTFDKQANGTVFSEGCGVVLLKPLSQAELDGDSILGVIKGSGVNQDGRTNGITAPSANSQTNLINRIYEKYNINPSDITYVEAHGTATLLGDPIEVQALTSAFQKTVKKHQYCAIGSVKSNIGHGSYAAGVAGLIKTLLCLKHRQYVPTAHFKEPNRLIDFEKSPFFVSTNYERWPVPECGKRIAAISSFGFSGTNAHVVLQEYHSKSTTKDYFNQSAPANQHPVPVIVPLSAKTNESLIELAKNLSDYLRTRISVNDVTQSDNADTERAKHNVTNVASDMTLLSDVAYTLQVGRDSMDERVAFVVSSLDELVHKLDEYVEKNSSMRDCYQGRAKGNNAIISFFNADNDVEQLLGLWIQKGKISKFLSLWVNGMSIDWSMLYDGVKPNRTMLPTYPFAKNRYWITENAGRKNKSSGNSKELGAAIHPLLHKNKSSLFSQTYCSTFTGSEYFFSKSASGDVLVELVFLEMARVAISESLGGMYAELRIDLLDTHWFADMLGGTEPSTINVELHDAEFDNNNDLKSVNYTIYSMCNGDTGKCVHMQGRGALEYENRSESVRLDDLLKETHVATLDAVQCDAFYQTLNLHCIPSELGLQKLYLGDGQAIVEHRLPPELLTQHDSYLLHPASMILVCKTAAAVVKGVINVAGNEPVTTHSDFNDLHNDVFLLAESRSHSIEKIEIFRPPSETMYTWIRYSNSTAARGNIFNLDIFLCDTNGLVSVKITGYEVEINFSGNNDNASLLGGETGSEINNNTGNSTSNDMSCKTNSKAVDVPELQVFEHHWVQAVLPNVTRVGVKTVVCFLSDRDLQDAFSAAIRSVSESTNILFVAQEGTDSKRDDNIYVATVNNVNTYQQVFHNIRDHVGDVDAILYLWPLEGRGEHKDVLPVLSLIESLTLSGLSAKQLFVADQIAQDLALHYWGRWHSVVQSCKHRLPGTVVSVIACQCSEAVKAWEMKDWAMNLLGEMQLNQANHVLYRDGLRFVQLSSQLPDLPQKVIPIKQGGTCLLICDCITLGNTVAEYLARSGAGKLLVVAPLIQGDNAKHQLVMAESGGIVIKHVSVDSLQLSSVQQVLNDILQKDEAINAVFYTANMSGQLLNEKDAKKLGCPDIVSVLDGLYHPLIADDNCVDFVCCLLSSVDSRGNNTIGGDNDNNSGMARVTRLNYRCDNGIDMTTRRPVIIEWSEVHWPAVSSYTPASVTLLNRVMSEVFLRNNVNEFSVTRQPLPKCDSIMPSQTDRYHLPDHHGRPIGTEITPDSQRRLERTGDEACPELTPSELGNRVMIDLKQLVHELLKLDLSLLEVDNNFSEYGFDSISLTAFSQRLSRHFDTDISPSVLFGNTSLEKLAAYLLTEKNHAITEFYTPVKPHPLDSRKAAIANKPIPRRIMPTSKPAPARRQGTDSIERISSSGRIAVIGMSGKLPMADNLTVFWENLKAGKDCISSVPGDRWDNTEAPGGVRKDKEYASSVARGGFINGIAEFDPAFFGISDHEAALMDPQQRLMMTYVYHAIEDAGYSPKSLAGKNIAVFIGTANNGYGSLIEKSGRQTDAHAATGTQPSVGPNRISFYLDLRGPSEPIETACASSLVAVRRGITALNDGCDMAIVGGVNTLLSSSGHAAYSQAGMLSPDGHCKSFSANADGFVRSEGIGILVLKSLDEAKNSGDHVYGLICGSAESHGGRSHSLTTPNPTAQMQLLEKAYQDANIDPRTVTYIEAHGTGTQLGDSIEIDGLKSAFKALITRREDSEIESPTHAMPVKPYCGVGTVKTNIGHTELASGVVGIIKVLLQLKHATLVKNINTSPLSPYLQLEGSPFFIVQNEQKWEALIDKFGAPMPRRAGVSAIGMGGVNAHVIVEEYIETRIENHAPDEAQLVVFSAKTKAQLESVVRQMMSYVVEHQGLSLPDFSYTLKVGRDQLSVRVAMIVSNRDELVQGMIHFLKLNNTSNLPVPVTFIDNQKGSADIDDRIIREFIAENNLEQLGQAWVNGKKIPWELQCKTPLMRRISLPMYPFDKKYFWVSARREFVGQTTISTNDGLNKVMGDGVVKESKTRSSLYDSWALCD